MACRELCSRRRRRSTVYKNRWRMGRRLLCRLGVGRKPRFPAATVESIAETARLVFSSFRKDNNIIILCILLKYIGTRVFWTAINSEMRSYSLIELVNKNDDRKRLDKPGTSVTFRRTISLNNKHQRRNLCNFVCPPQIISITLRTIY